MSRDGLESTGSDPLYEKNARAVTAPLEGRPSRTPPPRQIHRCRRWFRTRGTGWTSAPSIGSSWILRSRRALPRSLFTRTTSPRTLSLAASLGLPRQRPPGRLNLSPCRREPPCGAPRGMGKMRLTDFCNRLRLRVPCGFAEFPAAFYTTPPPRGGQRREERKLTLCLSRTVEGVGRPRHPHSR